MRDFLNWTYLKSPHQYICVYLRAQIALSLFWMLNKVNVYKICRSHILELELINWKMKDLVSEFEYHPL